MMHRMSLMNALQKLFIAKIEPIYLKYRASTRPSSGSGCRRFAYKNSENTYSCRVLSSYA